MKTTTTLKNATITWTDHNGVTYRQDVIGTITWENEDVQRPEGIFRRLSKHTFHLVGNGALEIVNGQSGGQ